MKNELERRPTLSYEWDTEGGKTNYTKIRGEWKFDFSPPHRNRHGPIVKNLHGELDNPSRSKTL